MEKIYKGEIQRLFPIFEAIKEGKTIQFSVHEEEWIDVDGDEDGFALQTLIDNSQRYRIKPEQKYRPFKDAEECWQEMLKHKPFGWVKGEEDCRSVLITVCENDGVFMGRNEGWNFKDTLDLFTFVDGTPFGVKVEEQL